MWEDNITGSYDLAVGPQSDGTSVSPTAGAMPQPVDAGGGFAGTYGKDVLDIFKYGVGIYSQNKQQSDLLDYKRFEATQLGVFRQGQPAVFSTSAQGGTGNLVILAAIVIGAVVLLQEQG
jgi:hypothetical protein